MPRDGRAGSTVAPDMAPVVLIVDDNDSKRLALQTMLSTLGYEIVEAESGRSALRHILARTFAVILMDVRMPIMDGYETARLIRQRNKTRLTPIIFVTSHAREDIAVAAAYATGAVDFIFAPVSAVILRAKVTTFAEVFIKTQELEESVRSVTSLNHALREAEARSRAVLQHVGGGILTAGDGGLVESANRAAQIMFGYLHDDMVGEKLDQIIEPQAEQSSRAVTALSGRPGAAERREVVCRRLDGSSFPAEAEMSEVTIEDRRITIAFIRDITERVTVTRQGSERADSVRREAQREHAAFDEAPVGSVIASGDGRIERVNQAVCMMTGYRAEELIGTYIFELAQPDDGIADEYGSEPTLSAITTTARYEKRYTLRDGSILEAYIAVTAIRDDAHQVVQLFAQIEDVTAVRRTERELRRSQLEVLERLAAAAELRDDDTGQHTRRVGDLSVAIATTIGLPDSKIELIRLAAPLHDLGKIAIPDAILSKPGKLTADEFDQMKAHTTIGARSLAGGAIRSWRWPNRSR